MTQQQKAMRLRQLAHLQSAAHNIPLSSWYGVTQLGLSGPYDLEEAFDDNPGLHLYEQICAGLGIAPRPELVLDEQSGNPRPRNDLGLRALSDDQLLDLMEQGWAEIASRTEPLWNLWMNTKERIEAEAKERAQVFLHSFERARKSRLGQMAKEAEAKIAGLAAQGAISLLTPELEASVVNIATMQAKMKLVEEFSNALQSGTLPKFSLEVEDGVLTLHSDGKKIESVVPPARAVAFVESVKQFAGV